MARATAAHVLGVEETADLAEVRRAYRRLIGRHHPDRAGAGATENATEINLAYAVLRTTAPAGQPSDRPAPTPAETEPTAAAKTAAAEPPTVPPTTVGVTGDDDTLAIALPPDEAFLAVLDAGHQLGEVTYVDPDNSLLEVVVSFLEAPTSSVVVTFQGRADHTDAFCTIESLGAGPPPPLADVVSLLAAAIRFG